MNEITTTRQVRTDFAYLGGTADEHTYNERTSVFDRWLAEHDRQVLASRPDAPAGATVTREAVKAAWAAWFPGTSGPWSVNFRWRLYKTLADLGVTVTDTPTGAHLRVLPHERYDAVLDPGQVEVTFETNLLDPVWLTTSSGRCTTRPVPAPVQVTTAERREALASLLGDLFEGAVLWADVDAILAALGIVVSDRPEVTP